MGRWKPVLNTDEAAGEEDPARHPSIIKAGLDETAMTEAGEADTTAAANINNDLTTVTWTSDEKEDLKKEEPKEDVEKKEEEKKEEEKDTEKEGEEKAEE